MKKSKDKTTCNLDCISPEKLMKRQKELERRMKIKQMREYVGPVRIIIVAESPFDYVLKVVKAGAVSYAYFLMGIVVTPAVLYTLDFRLRILHLLHVLFGTLGMILLLPSGILTLNEMSASSAPMKKRDRRKEHERLQIVGFLSLIISALLISIDIALMRPNYLELLTGHVISSGVALLWCFINVIKGFSIKRGNAKANTHRLIGIQTLILCVTSFCFAIQENSMVEVYPKVIRGSFPYLMMAINGLLACMVLIIPLQHLFHKTKKKEGLPEIKV